MKKVVALFCLYSLVLTIGFSSLQAQQVNKPQTAQPVTPTVNQVPAAYGSNVPVNLVRTWVPTGPITDPIAVTAAGYNDVLQSTQYADGLGRPLQTVSRQISPQKKDMVAPVVYDELGREAVKYLPYTSTENNGMFKTDPFNSQQTFMQGQYSDEQVYYSQIEFEPSPLSRVTKTMAAGNSWAGNKLGIAIDYQTNAADDAVRIWNIDNNVLTYNTTTKDVSTNIPYNPVSPTYNAAELFKIVTANENGNKVIEFKDKQGRIILKKVESGEIPVSQPTVTPDLILPNATYPSPVSGDFQASHSITLDNGFESGLQFTAQIGNASTPTSSDDYMYTYYVYDDLNQLRFVMPPKAVGQLFANGWSLTPDIINELCFRYEYDKRGRMIAKKLPGADWIYMVYDERDLLVFSQDGNMRNNGQWMTFLYDRLNRLALTGIMTNYNGNAQALQSDVTAITGTNQESTVEGIVVNRYPVPSNTTFTALTKTHYDNYGFTGKHFTNSYNGKMDAGNNAHPVAMPTVESAQTLGLVTGTEARVLTDPNNLASGNWLTTVNFYDDLGRVIQTNLETLKGTDIITNQYDFTSKVICSYLDHNNPGGKPASVHVKTSMEYDHASRLQEIWKTFNDDNAKKSLIVKNTYNESGKLTSMGLGHKKQANDDYTTPVYDPLETLNYTYNIRGWMTGINKDYANRTGNPDAWFGMEVNYDKGFQISQYNGNISGVKWRSRGDDAQRSYGYTYDKANRLLGADFAQYDGGYIDHPTIQFDMVMGDGQNPSTAYDANGNFILMKQWGVKLGQAKIIDNLEYTYYKGGNRMEIVKDNAVDANGVTGGSWGLGDFTDNNNNGDDYGYDANGNMVVDLNKKLAGNNNPNPDVTIGGAISYNLLNLPWQVQVEGGSKGTITYMYDASGTKLQKEVVEKNVSVSYNNSIIKSDITTTTSYIGGIVYESKSYKDNALSSLNYTDKLQYISHEEGRTRFLEQDNNFGDRFENDFFIKDNLGNTRLVLTEEPKNNIYQATMETANRAFEVALFGDKVNATAIDPLNSNNLVNILNGTTADGRVGPGVILKVMAGDKIKALANYWYDGGGVDNNPPVSLSPIITNLLSQLTPGVANFLHGTTGGQVTGSILQPGMESLLQKQNPQQQQQQGIPKAYLNWVLLDEEELKMADGNAIPVQAISGNQYQLLDAAGNGGEIEMKKNGYLYVFVSNESQSDVYFDNIRIEHSPGALLEETHYYPFGLTMAGISSKAACKLENKLEFNEKEKQAGEFNDGSGLEMYDFGFRTQDPQTGRFLQIDPHAENYLGYSPYVFALNNPVNVIDPDGQDAVFEITRNAQGEISNVTITSTIYLTGDADQNMADEANKELKDKFTSGTSDDGSVTIDFKVTYKYKEKIEEKDLGAGENILTVHNDAPPPGKDERSNVNSEIQPYETEDGNVLYLQTSGRTGDMYKLTPKCDTRDVNLAVFHESLHFLGLSDRYKGNVPHPGFVKSALVPLDYRIGDTHYRDYFNYFAKFKQYPACVGVLSYRVDIQPNGKLTPASKKDLDFDKRYDQFRKDNNIEWKE